MGAAKKLINKKVLRDLVPINALSAGHIQEISKKAIIEDIRSGDFVFKAGDRDYQTVYLLEGQVELIDKSRNVVETVNAGSEISRHPLAHKQPRQFDARASEKVTVARVDSSLLDVLLTWDESAGYDVVEIDAQQDDDWMTRMLQSQAFLQLPPSNIHQLLMRLEPVSVNAGDIIVLQGEEGDYFYIVKSGRLAVTRKASERSKEVLIAELGEGACFGEEALVSGTKRNASVMMITDGSLMRLSKQDFNELLCAPLVHEADFEGARKLVAKGAKWLDVRLPGEFDNQAIKGSSNFPLSALREQCEELDSDTDYIVCCDTGRRSAAGAFVLNQRGFSVYTLKNGLMDVPDEALTKKQHAGASASSAQDADIIPFDSDTRAESEAPPAAESNQSPTAEDDSILIDRLAAAENDKLALEQQVEQFGERLQQAQARVEQAAAQHQTYKSELEQARREANSLREQIQASEQSVDRQTKLHEQEKRALRADLASIKSEYKSRQQRLESADSEKNALQQELSRLQQTLAQIQQSADGRDDALRNELGQMADRLDSEQKQHNQRAAELEAELHQVRDDYHQLGQRTGVVAGERDAAISEREEASRQLKELQDRLESAESGQHTEVELLQRTLVEREQALERQNAEAEALRQELKASLENFEALTCKLNEAGETAGQHQSQADQLHASEQQCQALNEQLEVLQNQIQQTSQQAEEGLRQASREHEDEQRALGQRIEELRQQLSEAQQQAAQAQESLQAVNSQAGTDTEKYSRQLEDLKQELQEQQQLNQEQVTEKETLKRQLAAVQKQLHASDDQGQSFQLQLEEQRKHGEENTARIQQKADHADTRVAELEEALNQERKSLKEVQKRNAELSARMAVLDKEHEADVSTTRQALSRAQTETENIKREQSRLMESVRKAERDLERERLDHQNEVHRLHKELKQASGGSSDALAAELEAMQEKIREDARERDDLEIKLGERSAQLESVQVDAKRLEIQLHQAQESARQAEQQLIEANHAANDEMAVRMEAEEKAQQALRIELAGSIAERNQAQEKLTIQMQELEDLRQATQVRKESLLKAEAERDEALQKQELIQQEVDRLRAEAEVTRGLVDMGAPAEAADEALREELVQAKKNVEVAVRLRSQAEEKTALLEVEVGRLQARLVAANTPSQGDSPPGYIPSLDANDPLATTVLNPEYGIADGSEPGVAVLLGDNDEGDLTASLRQENTSLAEEKSAGRKGLIAALLAVAAVVAGLWWVSTRQAGDFVSGTAGSSAQPGSSVSVAKPSQTPVSLPEKVAEKAESTTNTTGSRENTPEPASTPPESDKPTKVISGSTPRPVIRDAPPAVPSFNKGSSNLPDKALSPTVSMPEETVSDTVAEPREEVPKPLPAKPRKQPVRSYSEPLADGGRAPAMVEFQADSYEMGSGVASAYFDERPRHVVSLKRFAISKQEVTFAEYAQFTRSTGRRLPSDAGWGRGERPVINVSWKDAVAYTRWLSEQTGSHYRLPTEAEWEFAARAGSDARFWWGNEPGKANANCFDCGSQWSGQKTAPVGRFSASPYGVQDMAGNVMEWVEDCYHKDYTSAAADGAAAVGGSCDRRVVRGGAYSSPSANIRSASRDARDPGTRVDDLGFRVVRD